MLVALFFLVLNIARCMQKSSCASKPWSPLERKTLVAYVDFTQIDFVFAVNGHRQYACGGIIWCQRHLQMGHIQRCFGGGKRYRSSWKMEAYWAAVEIVIGGGSQRNDAETRYVQHSCTEHKAPKLTALQVALIGRNFARIRCRRNGGLDLTLTKWS